MKRVGIVRESSHPANSLIEIAAYGATLTPLTLPRLKYLKIAGDASLGELAQYRYLEELDINVNLTHKTFANFISSAHDSILGENLKILSIKLSQIMETPLTFPMLANAFPKLERLSLEHATVDFEVRSICTSSKRTLIHVRISGNFGEPFGNPQSIQPARGYGGELLLLQSPPKLRS